MQCRIQDGLKDWEGLGGGSNYQIKLLNCLLPSAVLTVCMVPLCKPAMSHVCCMRDLIYFVAEVHPGALQKFPKLSKTGLSLLNGLLTYDPDRRMTARQALKHPYFKELPLATLPHNMPYFPSAHDADANDDQHKRYSISCCSPTNICKAYRG